MSNRKMVEGLRHWHGTSDEFFTAIDLHGGWPLGYRYVGFCHSDEREAGFTNSSHNDGWWTVVASSDDYYIWKLTPEAIQRIADAVTRALPPIRIDAAKLYIKDSRGYRALVSKAAEVSA